MTIIDQFEPILPAGSNKPADQSHKAFDALTREEQKQAIFDLADQGYSDHGIAAATRLAREFIREVLAERVS